MKIKSFECPKSIKNYGKKNTWNVSRLVDESFVPSAHRTSVLYCKSLDFYSLAWVQLVPTWLVSTEIKCPVQVALTSRPMHQLEENRD